jgi:hypothetical protein
MIVEFADKQDRDNPLNGSKIADDTRLSELLESLRNRKPFFLELSGDHGYKILIGLGGSMGCVQFSRTDGDPPYLMAIGTGTNSAQHFEFLAGNTSSSVPPRFILPFETVKEIAVTFQKTGARSRAVFWEEI